MPILYVVSPRFTEQNGSGGPKPMLNVLTWTSQNFAARKCPSSWMKMIRLNPIPARSTSIG